MAKQQKKKCYRCGELRPVIEYSKDERMTDGLKRVCDSCAIAISTKNDKHKLKKQVQKRAELITNQRTKQCSRCGEDKPVSEFYKVKSNKDGLAHKCRLCMKIASCKNAVPKNQPQHQEYIGFGPLRGRYVVAIENLQLPPVYKN